jgi:hypothetical protein
VLRTFQAPNEKVSRYTVRPGTLLDDRYRFEKT